MTGKGADILKTLIAGLISAPLLLGAAQSFAADDTGQFAIKGGGLQTCAKFSEAFNARSDDLKLYGGWIEGYLTGQNQRLDDTYDIAPWQSTNTILGAMHSVCQSQSSEMRFIDAFDLLVRAFLPSRLPKASTLVPLSYQGQSTLMYRDVLDLITNRLNQLGYENTTNDTGWSQEASDALAKFQEQAGLPETGFPDQRTMFVLFVTSLQK